MAEPRLFPAIEPFARFYLPVSGGHEIYVEQCGRPDGKPVVVLHGGPGAGCSPYMRRFFDPSVYRIVLFDQRGAGRSRPHGSLEQNTTWDLVTDIETIRRRLGIERWVVFGGSWGSTLALLYAQMHPERAIALLLRGIFTMTDAELAWFYGGGAARFYPDAWSDFVSPIPQSEQDDLISAYHRRLTSDDQAEQTRFARPWVRWESATASLRPTRSGLLDGLQARAFARIECHYFRHRGWLERDDEIQSRLGALSDVPGVIVQGRYDVICPPITAMRLAEGWRRADLRMIDDAGHALSEPGITAALLRATEAFSEYA